MSTVIDEKGLLSIPDASGELFLYAVRPAEAGAALFAATLVRLDTGASYRVEQVAPGRWRCACKDALYRKRGSGPCKHVESLMPLRLVLQALAPAGVTP